MNGLIAGGVAVLAVLGLIGWQANKIDTLKAQAAVWAQAEQGWIDANTTNQAAIDECEAVAAENLAKAEAEEQAARVAAAEARRLRAELDTQLLEITSDVSTVLSNIDGSCPAVRDPEYLDFLCSGPLGCTSSGP